MQLDDNMQQMRLCCDVQVQQLRYQYQLVGALVVRNYWHLCEYFVTKYPFSGFGHVT